MTHWTEHQRFEADWWGNCANTFGEEAKQITYAHRMGLSAQNLDGHWPVYDIDHRSILDIGGGPVSLLLKCVNRGHGCTVMDPCQYPDWTRARYDEADIVLIPAAAEEMYLVDTYDEAWIYNVLQHVRDPEKIIFNAFRAAPVIRLFEWVDTPAHLGHPHELTVALLSRALGGSGVVEHLDENGATGHAYYGTFRRPTG